MVTGRPVKRRKVAYTPEHTYFKPSGVPMIFLEEICLTIDEAESIRLKDLECLEQEECAKKMNISRPTFHRILNSARQKLADALLNGKAIRIEGGNFIMATSYFKCIDGHEWEVPFEKMIDSPPLFCPTCHSKQFRFINYLEPGENCKAHGKRLRKNIHT
jgi:predicted DNA-binding protein (UPF0251 family)